jgi:hypothetical protein
LSSKYDKFVKDISDRQKCQMLILQSKSFCSFSSRKRCFLHTQRQFFLKFKILNFLWKTTLKSRKDNFRTLENTSRKFSELKFLIEDDFLQKYLFHLLIAWRTLKDKAISNYAVMQWDYNFRYAEINASFKPLSNCNPSVLNKFCLKPDFWYGFLFFTDIGVKKTFILLSTRKP